MAADAARRRHHPHRLRPDRLLARARSGQEAARRRRHARPRDPRQRPRARRRPARSSSASPTPTASAARSRRRSRPSRGRCPARCRRQDHRGRGRPAGDDAERRQPALGGQRLDHLQQQGQARPPVRAVLHRHPPLRVRRHASASARCCSTTRSSASSPRCTPTTPGRRWSSTRGSRRPGTSTTPCWSPTPRPTPTWATSSAACRTPTTCPPGTRCAPMRPTLAAFAAALSGRDRSHATRRAAAEKTAAHADTPTVAHFDSLGRTFLTVAHNRFKYSDTPPADPPVEEFHRHPRRPRHRRQPARGHRRQGPRRHALRLRHARQPHPPGQHGGGRALDAERRGRQADPRLGQPRPPVPHRLRPAAPADGLLPDAKARARRCCVGRTVYGESTHPNPEASNLRGKVVELLDQAGVVTSDAYDFKGNLLRSPRQLGAVDYKTTLDWSGRPCRWKPRPSRAAPATTRSTARSS